MSVFLTNSKWKMTEAGIRALISNNVDVVAGDTRQRIFNPFPRTKFVKYPLPEREEFIPHIYKIIENSNVEVLFPMSNDTVIKISENKKLLEELCVVPIPEHETLLKAHDKLKTARLAESLNIPTPKTYFFNDVDSLISFSETIDYPLIIKPRMGGGASVYLYKVNSKNELISAYNTITKNYGQPIIQEYIPGNSEQMCTVNALFDKKSVPLVLFTAKKIREYPIKGGVTSCGISTYEPELIEFATRLFSQIGWYGVAEIEFKVDPRDGKPKLIEINPRFWQYLQLPIACGVNFPYLLYKIALDEEIEYESTYKMGLKYINPIKDALSISSNLWKSHFDSRVVHEIIESYRGEKTYSVHSWMDLSTILCRRQYENFN